MLRTLQGHIVALQWRHNGRDSFSNHQPHDCLLNRLFRRRSMKISKLRVTGLCAGNSPGTDEFPAQMASNVENVHLITSSWITCMLMTERHDIQNHSDDTMAWKRLPHHWLPTPMDSPHKRANDAEILYFMIVVSQNNRVAGDLRRLDGHVTSM